MSILVRLVEKVKKKASVEKGQQCARRVAGENWGGWARRRGLVVLC